MCIELAMLHKFQHPVRSTKTTIKIAGNIVGIYVQSLEVQMSPAHLGEWPRRRYDHTLRIRRHSNYVHEKWQIQLTFAPSLARSHSMRPLRNRRLLPCRPIFGHFDLRNRPSRDQWLTLRNFIRWSKMSKETPRNSCPMITSGSILYISPTKMWFDLVEIRGVYSRMSSLRTIVSFATADMTPLPLVLARASKFGGNLFNGLTNVWTRQGSLSGGVGSSICTELR